MRIGYGEDIHALKSGRKLILGGVHIPYEFGLDGHSDADVVYHALSDALLGSLALGDCWYFLHHHCFFMLQNASRKGISRREC